MSTELILASGSRARRQMLEAAGLAFRVVPADVDEEAHRRAMVEHDVNGGPPRVAQVLARVKAEEVSRRFPHALVIGADQVLALRREIFTKPPISVQHARRSSSSPATRITCTRPLRWRVAARRSGRTSTPPP